MADNHGVNCLVQDTTHMRHGRMLCKTRDKELDMRCMLCKT